MAKVTETCNFQQITISDVSKLDKITTSEVFVYGISWSVNIFKHESWLCAKLICDYDDGSSNWPISGAVSCKLLPFSDDLDALEKISTASVFDRTRFYGVDLYLIKWDDLFDEENKYVQNDTIKLELKIEAQNPNDPKKCDVRILRDCKNSVQFQLIVKNVSNLMAVEAHPFKLHGLTWHITVGKDKQLNSLFAALDFDASKTKKSCDVTWSMKLLSSKEEMNPIEKSRTDSLPSIHYYLIIENIVSWNELFKPENGYVHNNSITFEFELKSNKRRQSNANAAITVKRARRGPSPSPSSSSSE